MKKFLVLAATAALALSSCSSDDLVQGEQPVVEDGAVVFSAYAGRSTRDAAPKDPIADAAGFANAGGFGVFAYDQGTKSYTTYSSSSSYPNFMYNQNVYATSDAAGQTPVNVETSPFDVGGTVNGWGYSPIKYYNNNEGAKHSFFVYAPYAADVKSIFALGNAPAIRYVGGVDNYDLMWATPYVDIPKIAVDQKLDFNFKHALSQVNIYVAPFVDYIHSTGHTDDKGLNSKTNIKVRSIKFVGTVASQGLLSLADGSWRYEATEESAYEINDEKIILTSDNSTSASNKYYTVKQNMKVIPTLKGQPIQIQVVYDVITTDANNSVNSSTITNTITSVEKFDLVQGTAYNFYLDLGMTSVKFDAKVTDWTADVVNNVDLPNNNDFHLIAYATGSAAPEAGTVEEVAVKPATTDNEKLYYNTADGQMYVGGNDNAWAIATASKFYYDGTHTKYYDVTYVAASGSVPASAKTVVTEATYAYAGTKYYSGKDELATQPTPLYSLTVDSKGRIQTDATTWVDPTPGAYYTFDGKLYQWVSSAD